MAEGDVMDTITPTTLLGKCLPCKIPCLFFLCQNQNQNKNKNNEPYPRVQSTNVILGALYVGYLERSEGSRLLLGLIGYRM